MADTSFDPDSLPVGSNRPRPVTGPDGLPHQAEQLSEPAARQSQQAEGRPAGRASDPPMRPAADQRLVQASRQPMRSAPVTARPISVREKARSDEQETKEKEEAGEPDVLEEVAKQAPPWLISTVFHTILVIFLGILVTVVDRTRKTYDVEIDAKMIYAEQLGEQLEDPSILNDVNSPDVDNTAKEQIITPQDLPPVDDPFATPPQLAELDAIGTGFVAADTTVQAPTIGLALSGRQAGSHKTVLLGKYGGTAITEGAVISGLRWLANNQKSDGSWSLLGPYKDGGSEENSAAATAMALLAFQGQGSTHRTGKFKDNVIKGWKFLIKLQDKDGNFVTSGPTHQRLYAQAQCTIALCELYGMTMDSNYRFPAERAIKFALAAQDKKLGGWRYVPGEDSDTSVTGWYVMALQSARMAKLEVPQAALDKISQFLDSVQQDGGKTYTYTIGTFSTPAVTAEGLLCRQYLGWKQDDPRLVEGVGALNRNPVDYSSGERDVYYWYYATQACHHMEDNPPTHKIWSDWNEKMRQAVPEQQIKKGAEAGSWDPDGDKWGTYGGRLYVTCLSIYMLEVYYRHLPIYSGYKYVAK